MANTNSLYEVKLFFSAKSGIGVELNLDIIARSKKSARLKAEATVPARFRYDIEGCQVNMIAPELSK